MNRVLRFGLIALAAGAGCMVLLLVLNLFGVARFGPCGPDGLGLALFLGCIAAGSVGILSSAAGLVLTGVRRLRH